MVESLPASLKKYIKLTSGDAVKSLCKPIFDFLDLNYFLYVKHFLDGRRVWLTTHGEWTEHFYKLQYYRVGAFEEGLSTIQLGYHLWSTLPGQEIYQDARENFGFDHGITIVSRLDDAYEFVHLASRRDNVAIVNDYINYYDFINQFILYFRDKGQPLIKLAEDLYTNEIDFEFNKRLAIGVFDQHSSRADLPKLDFERKILSHNYNNVHLTQREIECIEWLKRGKTALEMSMILGISKRTAEAHIENIKNKLNCYNLFQLGYCVNNIDKHQV